MRNDVCVTSVLVLAIWLVFIVDSLIPATLTDWGLRPRSLSGMAGIVLMPLLHESLGHILGNTFPLIILLMLLSGSRANNWAIVVGISLFSGLLLWLFGRSAIHVGASGLVFGLIGFLIVSGVLEKRLVPMAISLIVAVLYGGTVLIGLVPRWGSSMSWDGHLCGLIAGVVIAYLTTTWSKSERMFLVGKKRMFLVGKS